ncbi:hypothetical protein HAP94_13090 [Acidithiobacillus ferrivorans]|nr:hypothetical protein [Acidithiobacillus ferrivorans]
MSMFFDEERRFVVVLDFESVLMDYDHRYKQCLSLALGRDATQIEMDEGKNVPENTMKAGEMINSLDQWTVPVLAKYAKCLIDELHRMGCDVWVITSVDPIFHEGREHALSGLIRPEQVMCVGRGATPELIVDILLRIGTEAYLGSVWEYGYGKLGGPSVTVAAKYANTDHALSALLDESDDDMDAFVNGATTLSDVMDFPLLVWEKLRQANLVYYYGHYFGPDEMLP